MDKEGANGSTAKLPVKIRTLTGKTFKIEAKTNWTVAQLKEEFAKWHEGADRTSLFYKAKRLNDTELLKNYNIEPGTFIQANIRSVGGEKREEDGYGPTLVDDESRPSHS